MGLPSISDLDPYEYRREQSRPADRYPNENRAQHRARLRKQRSQAKAAVKAYQKRKDTTP